MAGEGGTSPKRDRAASTPPIESSVFSRKASNGCAQNDAEMGWGSLIHEDELVRFEEDLRVLLPRVERGGAGVAGAGELGL